jgi:transcriptional regulator with XRE-family HTH domain
MALIPGKEGQVDQGNDTESAIATPGVVLATLLRQLRRRDGMDVEKLSNKLRVSKDELYAIEADKGFVPKPRTIYKIAGYYDISASALLKLSAAAAERDPDLDEVGVRFAARSENLSKLSRSERKQLNEFITVLSNYKERPKDAD